MAPYGRLAALNVMNRPVWLVDETCRIAYGRYKTGVVAHIIKVDAKPLSTISYPWCVKKKTRGTV